MKTCNPKLAKATDALYECNPATGRWVLKKIPKAEISKPLLKAPKPVVAPTKILKPSEVPNSSQQGACVPESGAKYLKRKSPAYSAANCPVGMVKEGTDDLYTVVANKNGVHRWVPYKGPAQNVAKPKKAAAKTLSIQSSAAPKTPDKVVLPVEKIQQITSQQEYDISKGVMKYKQLRPRQVQDNKEIMLKRYVDEDYYASRKYDGWQAVWDGRGRLTTKTGKNTFPAPASWYTVLPKGVPLAGELIIEGKQAVNVASLKKEGAPDWAKARFMVFDIPTTSKQPFSKRLETLQKVVGQQCDGIKKCPLVLVPQVKITSVDMLYDLFQQVIAEKGEGLVLTKAFCHYVPEKQSYQRVKLKGRNDTEGVIVGYHLNEKDPSLLKSLMVEMNSGVVIRIGIGFTNVQRKNYKKLFPLGKLAKFSFRELTDSGQPKQSRFLAIRQDLG